MFAFSALRILQIRELICLCINMMYLKWLFARLVHLIIKIYMCKANEINLTLEHLEMLQTLIICDHFSTH